mgnify:CR=1 FL=1
MNLNSLAHSVLDALEPILRDREANTEIVGEAPDVLGNPDRLKQAVTNLVENASRFIEPDGHITIELFGLKGNSILAVKDDAPGSATSTPSCCSTLLPHRCVTKPRHGRHGAGAGHREIGGGIARCTVEASTCLMEGRASSSRYRPSCPANASILKHANPGSPDRDPGFDSERACRSRL